MKIDFEIDDEYVLIAAKRLQYQPQLQTQTGIFVDNPMSAEEFLEAYLEANLRGLVEQAVLEAEANTYMATRRESFAETSAGKIKVKSRKSQPFNENTFENTR